MSSELKPELPILLVDDEDLITHGLKLFLGYLGYKNTFTINDSRLVLPYLQKQQVSAIILDMMMPHISGEELLREISSRWPDVPITVVTGHNDVETAVRCMSLNAYDYILKPIDENRFKATIQRMLRWRGVNRELAELKEGLLNQKLKNPGVFAPIITKDPNMFGVFRYLEAVAVGKEPILITGETGTGKELIGLAAHKASGRTGDYVAVDVAALDDTTFTDTLFGHKKGAFTGAERDRRGLVESATGGTLFLDEIGDLGQENQIKLLRLLQEGTYLPLGSDRVSHTDARIIVATNRNLSEMIESGKFRPDLYWRLQTHQVHLPPLRQRRDDLPLLLEHFLSMAASEMGKPVPTPPPELISLLAVYEFPGNIRELRAMVYDAVANHTSRMLSMERFKKYVSRGRVMPAEKIKSPTGEQLLGFGEKLPTLKQANHLLATEALSRAGNNRTLAAQLLGITRQTLARYLEKPV